MNTQPQKTPPPESKRPWLHWGLVVAGLYLALFTVITVPVLMASFHPKSPADGWSEALGVYDEWGYWLLLGIIVLSQFLFLRVPVRIAFQKPVSRCSVWLPILVSGFWFASLIWGAGFAVAEAIRVQSGHLPFLVFGVAVVSWLVWAVVFWRISRVKEAQELITHQTRWLLRGSILELLIVVPCHIIARWRNECCAGIFTFVGITMGVSVMLLSFGPAVFLLYHARWRRLKHLV